MLACEGVLECDELGQIVMNFVEGCRDKMSKQEHYDFGLRHYRRLIRSLGALLRDGNDWTNVKASTAKILARLQLASAVEEDRAVVFDLLKQFLVEVPVEQHSVVDHLETVL